MFDLLLLLDVSASRLDELKLLLLDDDDDELEFEEEEEDEKETPSSSESELSIFPVTALISRIFSDSFFQSDSISTVDRSIAVTASETITENVNPCRSMFRAYVIMAPRGISMNHEQHIATAVAKRYRA